MMLMVLAALPAWYALHFHIRQQVLEHRMEEELERQFLQKITVNRSDFTWVKKNREIRIEDRLFDVKRWEAQGETVIFYGLFDEDEIGLHGQLRKMQQHNRTNHGISFSNVILAWVWEDSGSNEDIFLAQCPIIQHRLPYAEELSPGSHTIFTPPPEA
jgi:hypothetical protein